MPKLSLTDEVVRDLDSNLGVQDYYDTTEGVPFPFGVRIGQRGKRWWTRYTLYGVRRRYCLGHFPQVKREQALWEAFDIHQKVRQGIDPQLERQVRRQAKTIEQVGTVYLKEIDGVLAPGTCKNYSGIFRREILPYWGKRSLDSLTRGEIRGRLRAIRDRGAGTRTHTVLAVISNLFKFAEAEGWIEGNPCIGMPGVWPKKRRTDFFSPDEIRQIWDYASHEPGSIVSFAWKVVLLTGQRPGEVQNMDHRQISGPWWELPNTKNGRAHLVYLSEPVLEIIQNLRFLRVPREGQPQPVFPGRRNERPFQDWGNYCTTARRRICIPHLRPHTARHTFITWLASQDVERHLIKAFVNHTSARDVTEGYNHYRYRPQRQKWLTRYAEYILGCSRGDLTQSLLDQPRG